MPRIHSLCHTNVKVCTFQARRSTWGYILSRYVNHFISLIESNLRSPIISAVTWKQSYSAYNRKTNAKPTKVPFWMGSTEKPSWPAGFCTLKTVSLVAWRIITNAGAYVIVRIWHNAFFCTYETYESLPEKRQGLYWVWDNRRTSKACLSSISLGGYIELTGFWSYPMTDSIWLKTSAWMSWCIAIKPIVAARDVAVVSDEHYVIVFTVKMIYYLTMASEEHRINISNLLKVLNIIRRDGRHLQAPACLAYAWLLHPRWLVQA